MSLKNLILVSAATVGTLLTVHSGSAQAQQSVMVAGDSISAGFLQPSYRRPLLDELASYGCDVSMVGDQTMNNFDFRSPVANPGNFEDGFSPNNGYDTDHQAFPAIRADQLADGVSNFPYVVDPIADFVSLQQPDFLLVHLGTNDMGAAFRASLDSDAEINAWVDETINDMRRFIDTSIDAHNNPSLLKILVANFIPYARETITPRQMVVAERTSDLYSQRLESLVLDMADPRVLIVDVATGFDPVSMTLEGIHPNTTGEQHMAGAFLPILRGAGLCPTTPTVNSPAVGASVTGDTALLEWSSNGLSVSRWRVRVGDTQSGSSNTYFDSGNLPGNTSSISITGLPADESNVFVSLQYTSSGSTDLVLSSFISQPGPGEIEIPDMNFPLPANGIPSSAVNFSWDSNGSAAIDWWVRIGSTFGGTEYLDSGRLDDPSTRAVSASGLPTNGSTVFLELNWKTPAGPWGTRNFIYGPASSSIPDKVLQSGDWYQIGLPYDPGSANTVEDVFGDALPANLYGIDWIVFEYQLHPTNQNLDANVPLDLSDTVEVGRGYWIQHFLGSPVTLEAPSGAVPVASNVSGSEVAACATPSRCYAIDLDEDVDENINFGGRFRMLSYPFVESTTPADMRVTAPTSVGCSSGTHCSLSEASSNDLFFETVYRLVPGTLIYDFIGPSSGTLNAWDAFWAVQISDAQGQGSALILSEP